MKIRKCHTFLCSCMVTYFILMLWEHFVTSGHVCTWDCLWKCQPSVLKCKNIFAQLRCSIHCHTLPRWYTSTSFTSHRIHNGLTHRVCGSCVVLCILAWGTLLPGSNTKHLFSSVNFICCPIQLQFHLWNIINPFFFFSKTIFCFIHSLWMKKY